MTTNLIHRVCAVVRTEGTGTLVWKMLRYIPLRLRLYVWLPLAYRLGLPTPLKLPDRTFLERDVFGWLAAKPEVKRVLFAGIESYTWHYYRLLPDKAFFTIDISPQQEKWGRKGFHTVGSVTDLSRLYKPESFDVVVMNGLIGWGLDKKDDINRSFHEAYNVLAKGGLLIVGWPNEPKYIDFRLDELDGYALFKPYVPKALGLEQHRVEVSPWRRHTFDFLIKA
ncbi:MAG: class I SAM-dependent methyltransferase [Blastochloris viridis]|uniref:Class I SAM-dependent methyltransferase n=1 Tax=Blastochloris viridis TaxID=1079 RepID=A0A6N4RD31_BLAVI|nr:MAG: class I SAM-dependent methyltransferase [Blastochloris viridis]